MRLDCLERAGSSDWQNTIYVFYKRYQFLVSPYLAFFSLHDLSVRFKTTGRSCDFVANAANPTVGDSIYKVEIEIIVTGVPRWSNWVHPLGANCNNEGVDIQDVDECGDFW